MRTTLTLDEDNAVRLERLHRQGKLKFKDVVNDAIRRGLDAMDSQAIKRQPFKTEAFDPGSPLLPIDNIGDVLEMLDEKDLEGGRSR